MIGSQVIIKMSPFSPNAKQKPSDDSKCGCYAARGRLLALPQNVAAMVAVEDNTGKCEAPLKGEI